MSRLRRLYGEARDLLELVLLPGIAAVLPWRMCFAVFKLASRWRFLYRDSCTLAFNHAFARGYAQNSSAWLRVRRLVTLVDHADLYLSLTRSDRWLQRHVVARGEWPEAGSAALLLTFHWGANMWALHHARASGMRPHALIAPLRGDLFPDQRVRFRYYELRNRAVEKVLGNAPLDVSRSMRPVFRALRKGEQVLAAVDVPSDQVQASDAIEFLGSRARVPRALFRVAADLGLPVTVFMTGIRLSDGKRMLEIHSLGACSEPEKLMKDGFAFLDVAIRTQPAAWHFWEVAPRFFEDVAA